MQQQVEASVYLAPPEMMAASGPYHLPSAPGASFYVPHRQLPVALNGLYNKLTQQLTFQFKFVDPPGAEPRETDPVVAFHTPAGNAMLDVAFDRKRRRVEFVNVRPFGLTLEQTEDVVQKLRGICELSPTLLPREVDEHAHLAFKATLGMLADKLHALVARLREKVQQGDSESQQRSGGEDPRVS